MDRSVVLGLPLVLVGSACAFGVRVGPEVRYQAQDVVLEGRGTAIAALAGTGAGKTTQIGIPVSFSTGARLEDGRRRSTFESGFEYTSAGERFGFRSSVRLGRQLGSATGGYIGVRGGPLLMLSPAEEGRGVPALTLEALAGVGLGGEIENAALLGVCLSIDLDYYTGFDLKIPSGRPFRCDDGETWRGRARLGRRRSASLGRGLLLAERERMGLTYLEQALDEHASVPAFERLALELAAHRAPGSLVRRARVAAAEEIRHAQVCFELASAYLGRHVSPPALRHTRLRRTRGHQEIARESFWDGCVGEATAAQALLERASRAEDISERRALNLIARDEHDHARLAADVTVWAAKARPRSSG